MGKKRRRKKKLSNEQKIARQKRVVDALREKYGDKIVIFGYCLDCFLPLTHPGVRVPLHTTFEWDDESPALLQKAPEYCVSAGEGCAARAIQRYQAAVEAGLVIQGTYHGPGAPPPVSEGPLDTEEGS